MTKCKKRTKGCAGCKPCNQYHTECDAIEESVNIVGGTGGERVANVDLADTTSAATEQVATAEPATLETTAAADTGLQLAVFEAVGPPKDEKIIPWLCDVGVEAGGSVVQESAAMDIVEQEPSSLRVIDLARSELSVAAVVDVVTEGSLKATERENPQ
jgi:hypothetical protein